MLLQPCEKCGTLITENQPYFTKTVRINENKYETIVICQRCYTKINEDNENSKLLVENN